MAGRRTKDRAGMCMMTLVDMNLLPRWVSLHYVVLTHDLDFSAILAAKPNPVRDA